MSEPKLLNREELEKALRWTSNDPPGEQASVAIIAHIAALEADNAALLAFVTEQTAVECEDVQDDLCGTCVPCLARTLVSRPHPGIALLDRIAALEKERDAALADNAALLEWAPHGATCAVAADGRVLRCHCIHSLPHPGAALLEQHRKALEPLRVVADGLAREIEAAVQERERPKGGMSVPFHGDFASAPPSMLNRLRWWARELRAALGGTPSALLVRARNEGLEEAALLFVTLEQNSEDEGDTEAALDARHWVSRIRAMKEPEPTEPA